MELTDKQAYCLRNQLGWLLGVIPEDVREKLIRLAKEKKLSRQVASVLIDDCINLTTDYSRPGLTESQEKQKEGFIKEILTIASHYE